MPPKPRPAQTPSPASRARRPDPPGASPAFPNVDPVWLAKTIALIVVLALLCGYATFCLLFFQGQWQLPLHPARGNPPPPTIAGTPLEPVRFSPDSSGSPQLTGFWLPSAPSSRPRGLTALFLPSGEGSLTDPAQLSTVAALHDAGLNVFAFDYRGFGQSSGPHPTQHRMLEDTTAAFFYLTNLRHLAPSTILLYSNGVAASLALSLAADQPAIPAILLDNPDTGVLERALSDPRIRLLPVRLLFHERFSLSPAITTLKTPKLILTRGPLAPPEILHAADPKLIVSLPNNASPALLTEALTRFLNQYTPGAPANRPAATPASAPYIPKSRRP